jgi:acyl carrier protein
MTAADDLRTRLTGIFRDVFDDDSIVLSEDMTADDIESWDSIAHVDLIVVIEREFKIRLTTGEVSGLNSVGELITLVSRKTGL